MTEKFGIEIEFAGMGNNTEDIAYRLGTDTFIVRGEGYNHETRANRWKVVPDGSVEYGAELVSPPLDYSDEGFAAVKMAFSRLNANRCQINSTCGLHVHIDARFLHGYTRVQREAFFNFLTSAFQANEDVFDKLVKNHRNNNRFCRSTKGLTWRNLVNDRYHKLNLASFQRHGTIEFRHFQGTLNADITIAWITVCMKFMRNIRERFESQVINLPASQPSVQENNSI